MSPVPEPVPKHVPAWKKLGLKLKFAKEEPEDTQPDQNGALNGKKRKAPVAEEAAVDNVPVAKSTKKVKKSKLGAEETGEAINVNGTAHGSRDEDKPRKKVKKLKSRNDETTEPVNGNKEFSDRPAKAERPSKKVKSKVGTEVPPTSTDAQLAGPHEQTSSPPPASKDTPASKGKSVSFTPDTKTKDGDSVKSLYKTWIAKQVAIDPSFDPSTVSPALRSTEPQTVLSPDSPSPLTSAPPTTSTSTSKPTTRKPIKKPKTRLPKTPSGPGPSRFDPVLTYLTTHHTSPQTWKFSKPHQNQILKHLFSLVHIPSSYDAALLPYIRGLKGTSARSRIRGEARETIASDDKWLASEPSSEADGKMENETAAQCNARRRRDYEAAVARHRQLLREKESEREDRESVLMGEPDEWEQRFLKRKRAEMVLWGVGEEDEEEEEVVKKEDEVEAPASSRHDQTSRGGNNRGGHDEFESGIAQLVHAARRDPGPAPRVGRGVGMGMGGVEVIDAGGIAKGSRGKKVVFGEDGTSTAGVNNGYGRAANGVGNGTDGVEPKRLRKRRRKRTGVPDDDDSSSESSSSSSSSEESEKGESQPRKVGVRAGGAAESGSSSETSSSGGESDSD